MNHKLSTWALSRPEKMHEAIPQPLPYQQGNMDGLCGVYAITNAVAYLQQTGMNEEETETLFARLVEYIATQQDFAQVFFNGIGDQCMGRLLKQIVAVDHPIAIHRPFYHRRADFGAMWRALTRFTAAGGVAIYGDEEHWWVIVLATATQWVVLDSGLLHGGRQRISRRELAAEGLDGRYLYFLSQRQLGVGHG